MLSEEAVEEFQALYKAEFGEEISFEEALEQGTNLLRLYKAVYKNEREPEKSPDNITSRT